jgi:hypothetical protein
MKLPAWAKLEGDTVIVDPDKAYPLYLSQIAGLLPKDATPAFGVAVARLCIVRDLAAQGVKYSRIRGGKGTWDSATLNGATTDAERVAAVREHDKGMEKGGAIRNRLLKKRAEQLALPE